MIRNPYILYILHNYLFMHFDFIEKIADMNIEHLAMLVNLKSISDIKDRDNWTN